jgi:acetyl-CoA acetyltransferase
MRRAAIVSPIRTGVGKYLGALSAFNAEDLGALVIKALIERTGIDPSKIEEVVFAQGYPSGEAPCIGRWAALAADLPLEVSGTQVDRRCGSGVQAIADGLNEKGYLVQAREGENSGLHLIHINESGLDGAADKRREGVVRQLP